MWKWIFLEIDLMPFFIQDPVIDEVVYDLLRVDLKPYDERNKVAWFKKPYGACGHYSDKL